MVKTALASKDILKHEANHPCRSFINTQNVQTNEVSHLLMSSPAKSEISSLVSLITEAAHNIESYYRANGENTPSLDDSRPHPLDNVPYPPDIRNAVQTIEGACLQLCATVAHPGHTILNVCRPHSPMIHRTFTCLLASGSWA